MAEMILPGTYIEVRAEGLITPERVTVNNVGAVGTAAKGPIDITTTGSTTTIVGVPTLVSSYGEARAIFGNYDAWVDGASDELTLVRALELAFAHGATTVWATRVASAAAAKASYLVSSASGDCIALTAKTEGSWGNDLKINIFDAQANAFVEDEVHSGPTVTLANTEIVKSARNRILLATDADGLTRPMQLLYADDSPGAPTSAQVVVDRNTGALTFGATVGAADTVTASYLVAAADSVKVTLKLGAQEEVYTVVSGADLANDIKDNSQWVNAQAQANSAELPTKSASATEFAAFGTGSNTPGANGEINADYKIGLDALLNEDAHIIVAAGQDDSFGDEMDAHCQVASSDAYRRERIGVVGSALGATLDQLRGHNLASDRVIFVGPGVKTTDAASNKEVTLPGAYSAAAIAGLLASYSPHVSLTNKTLRVGDLEKRYSAAELTQLVQARLLALEARRGIRVVKGITTSTNTAWHQITTRRIVDFAKIGVRGAASSFIGLLNNERVRGALRTSINIFLAEMVQDEMLISYDLNVSATREQERQGIVQVDMVLRPTFSIDFIKVTMFLE